MSANPTVPGSNVDQARLYKIFFPYASRRIAEATTSNRRLVYYTSADTAVSVIRNREVWMRKSSLMNDYREIEHGFDCLNAAYKKSHARMQAILDGMFPGLCARLEEKFNGWLPHFRSDTYIACASEHDDSEDKFGRLSMWRAYGGTTGVAIVLNGGPFFRPSDALKAYSSPIAYEDANGFEREFAAMIGSVEENADFLKSVGEEIIISNLFMAFRYSILSTKHSGFHEEREWRVIYSPSFQKSERLSTTIVSIDGTPQSICKIPLRDVPEEGLFGLELPELIDRVIIGPTKFPVGIYDALVTVLTDAGVKNAARKVIVSDIPLRQ
jgi:DUF2971 family protein